MTRPAKGPPRQSRGRRPRAPARAALVCRGDGGQQFIRSAARVGCVVGQAPVEIIRQFAAEPVAENDDDDVTFGRIGDLVLEGLVRLVERLLPAERTELCDGGEGAVQPGDNSVKPSTLVRNIARRGDEDLYFARRLRARLA